MPDSEEKSWYALKVFYNRTSELEKDLKKQGSKTYIPRIIVEKENGVGYESKAAVSSLLFVRCNEEFLVSYKNTHDDRFLYYCTPGTSHPGRIPDREMINFQAATSVQDPEAMVLGSDTEWFKDGQRVRVIKGIHEGREGWIRRIKGKKRFIVCIEGTVAVAFQAVPPSFLEEIEPSKR